MQKHFNSLYSHSVSPSYLQIIKVFVNVVLNYAVSEDYIIKNYCKGVKLPKIENKKTHKFLTDDEIKLLIDNCTDKKLNLIIKIALSTGMRINEILALKVADIDLAEHSISVNKTLSYSKNGIEVTQPKSGSSVRKVYFNKNIVNDINTHFTYEKERYLFFGKKFNDDAFIFTRSRLDFERNAYLTRKLNALFEKCGIDAKGFHVLRHTYGSKLYENGVDLKTISELLGHANISITSKIYIHLQEKNKKGTADILNNYFIN